MLRLRSELFVAFGVVAFAIGVACSSSSSSSSGASSSSGGASSSGTATGKDFHQCPAANTPASCSASDIDTYNTCIATKCDAQFQQCFGPGYKQGTFSGPCASLIACQQKCACADSQCIAACGEAPTACAQCEASFTTCSGGCQQPACYTATPDSGASSSSSSGSTGPYTCTQLAACCSKISDTSEQAQCNQIAQDGLDGGTDTACNISYSTFSDQATGGCP